MSTAELAMKTFCRGTNVVITHHHNYLETHTIVSLSQFRISLIITKAETQNKRLKWKRIERESLTLEQKNEKPNEKME